MPHLEAEFQERRRIVFTARERSIVNVRVDSADGGPVGYTSFELLLIALANCTLGVVMNHDSLKDVNVRGCRAVLDATMARGPSRAEHIAVRLELDVEGGDERLRQTLQRVADACPVGNTLRMSPEITVELALTGAGAAPGTSATERPPADARDTGDSIRVSRRTREAIEAIARESGDALDDVLAAALAGYRRGRAVQHAGAAYAALRGEAPETAEQQPPADDEDEWETLLMEGLEIEREEDDGAPL